jgi:hypothetical protein
MSQNMSEQGGGEVLRRSERVRKMPVKLDTRPLLERALSGDRRSTRKLRKHAMATTSHGRKGGPTTTSRIRSADSNKGQDSDTTRTIPNTIASLRSISFRSSTTRISRSTALIKERTELRFCDPPIHFVTVSHRGRRHPDAVIRMLDRFSEITRGFGVIPAAFKERIERERMLRYIGKSCFNESAGSMDVASEEKLWGEVMRLEKEAAECGTYNAHETDWFHQVVHPLLTLSLASRSETLSYRSVDTLSIAPSYLLPLSRSTNSPISLKRIDGILTLTSSKDRADNAFTRMDLPPDKRSVNQTTMPYHCDRPVAVGVEVKRERGVDPLMQLGIWVAAGWKKRIMDQDVRVGSDGGAEDCRDGPEYDEGEVMPGLAISGHTWDLHISYLSNKNEIILLGPILLGRTDTLLGIFQILAALTEIAKWAERDFADWFERVVWGRLEGTRNVEADARLLR